MLASLHRRKLPVLALLGAWLAAPPSSAQIGSAQLGSAGSSHALLQTASTAKKLTFVPPLDPLLVYSEYVLADVNEKRARFERTTIDNPGNTHSPGTRVSFVSDAERIVVRLDYQGTFNTVGSGLFRLEVDGTLQPAPIGSDKDKGEHAYVLFEQGSAQSHEFSLVFPYASDVDFQGLELVGGTPGLIPRIPQRPDLLYVAHGDSITHGFQASNVAAGYPYKVGVLQGWRVVNMGFTGRKIVPGDGFAIGLLQPDIVTLAIGINDYIGEGSGPSTAQQVWQRYHMLLNDLRAVAPTVPVFAITPIWHEDEGVQNSLGLTPEDYRDVIRTVVFQRTPTDPELYLIEGSVLVPPDTPYFADGVHPTSLGFSFYASALGDPNLVAEPGFEVSGYAWTDDGNSQVVATGSHSGLANLQVGPGGGGAHQPVGRVRRGQAYTLGGWSQVTATGEQAKFGISFHDEAGVELERQEIDVSWTSYQESSISFTAPAAFAYARVWCTKSDGSAQLHVDDLSLVENP